MIRTSDKMLVRSKFLWFLSMSISSKTEVLVLIRPVECMNEKWQLQRLRLMLCLCLLLLLALLLLMVSLSSCAVKDGRNKRSNIGRAFVQRFSMRPQICLRKRERERENDMDRNRKKVRKEKGRERLIFLFLVFSLAVPQADFCRGAAL